jgi:hypothetical protein
MYKIVVISFIAGHFLKRIHLKMEKFILQISILNFYLRYLMLDSCIKMKSK